MLSTSLLPSEKSKTSLDTLVIPYEDTARDQLAFDFIKGIDESGYVVSNEDPTQIRGIVKLAKSHINSTSGIDSALGIASGGECLLLGILPCFPRVHGVDLSYKSLAATSVKAGLIYKYGPRLKGIVTKKSSFVECVNEELIGFIPKRIREMGLNSYERIFSGDDAFIGNNFFLEKFSFPWIEITDEDLEIARSNLKGFSLEHGDITKKRRPVDLIYASNICEYRWSGKELFPSRPRKLAENLKEGRFIISSVRLLEEKDSSVETWLEIDDHHWIYGAYKKKS